MSDMLDTIDAFLTIETIDKEKNAVVITGSNGGIGIALCKKFYCKGWYVIGTDIYKDSNNEWCNMYIECNLELCTDIINLCEKIKEFKVCALVNNAALQICKSIWEMNVEEWDKIMNINVRSVFLLVKYLFESLKKNKGFVVNIGSVHSIASSDKIACYSCSKSAIVGLTKNLAIELAPYNITVNCISPGAIDTQMLQESLRRNNNDTIDVLFKKISDKHITKKIGKPFEIADIAYFLVSQKIINGANIIADNGATIKLSTE